MKKFITLILLLISCVITLSGCWPAMVARIHHKRQQEQQQQTQNNSLSNPSNVTETAT